MLPSAKKTHFFSLSYNCYQNGRILNFRDPTVVSFNSPLSGAAATPRYSLFQDSQTFYGLEFRSENKGYTCWTVIVDGGTMPST